MNLHVKILDNRGFQLPEKSGDKLFCFSVGRRQKHRLRRLSKRELRAMRVLQLRGS